MGTEKPKGDEKGVSWGFSLPLFCTSAPRPDSCSFEISIYPKVWAKMSVTSLHLANLITDINTTEQS